MLRDQTKDRIDKEWKSYAAYPGETWGTADEGDGPYVLMSVLYEGALDEEFEYRGPLPTWVAHVLALECRDTDANNQDWEVLVCDMEGTLIFRLDADLIKDYQGGRR